MRKITRIVLAGVGLSLVTLIFTFITSRPAPAQAPAPPPPVVPVRVTNVPLPVQGTVNANVTNTVPVSGSVNANVTNTVPVTGAVNANITNVVPVTGGVNANLLNPPLLPQLASQTITLSASSLVSTGCPAGVTNPAFEQYTFNTYVVKNTGVLEPFTLPSGKVLVVTQFDWVVSGSPAAANQLRTAYLFPSTTLGNNGAVAQSSILADSTGKAGGSETFPSGIVLQNPAFFCLALYPVVPGETAGGIINGYLTADQ